MWRWGLASAAVVACLLETAPSATAAQRWLPTASAFGDTHAEHAAGTMAADGTVVVARVRLAGALELRVRPPGGDFGAPIRLADGAADPLLVAGRGGHVALLWRDDRAWEWVSVRPPGGSFGEPYEVGAPASPAPDQVALDDGGRVWLARSGIDEVGVTTLGPDGVVRSFPLVAADSDWWLGQVALGVDAAGRVTVAYDRSLLVPAPGDGTPCRLLSEVRVAEGDAGGLGDVAMLAQATWSGDVDQCSLTTGEQVGGPSVAVHPDGRALATYSIDARPGGVPQMRVVAHVRPAGGSWSSSAEQIAAGSFGPTGIPAFAGATPLVVLYDGLAGTIDLASRDGGVWSAPRELAPDGGDWPLVASSPTGTAAVAYFEGGFGRPAQVMAVLRAPDGRLSAPQPLSGLADLDTAPVGVGFDDQGNAAVAFVEWHGFEGRAFVTGYDAAGPRLTASFPAGGLLEQPLSFAAAALDVWSGATTPQWTFGDGTSASGTGLTHAYASAGAFPASVTTVDGIGNASERSATVTIVPPTDATRPRFIGDRPSVRPRRLRRGGAARLAFAVSEAATVWAEVFARRPGVRRNGRCAAPRRRQHAAPGRRCRRTVLALTRSARVEAAVPGSISIRTRRLRPGRYSILLDATDRAGNGSAPVALTLTVLSRARR